MVDAQWGGHPSGRRWAVGALGSLRAPLHCGGLHNTLEGFFARALYTLTSTTYLLSLPGHTNCMVLYFTTSGSQTPIRLTRCAEETACDGTRLVGS